MTSSASPSPIRHRVPLAPLPIPGSIPSSPAPIAVNPVVTPVFLFHPNVLISPILNPGAIYQRATPVALFSPNVYTPYIRPPLYPYVQYPSTPRSFSYMRVSTSSPESPPVDPNMTTQSSVSRVLFPEKTPESPSAKALDVFQRLHQQFPEQKDEINALHSAILNPPLGEEKK